MRLGIEKLTASNVPPVESAWDEDMFIAMSGTRTLVGTLAMQLYDGLHFPKPLDSLAAPVSFMPEEGTGSYTYSRKMHILRHPSDNSGVDSEYIMRHNQRALRTYPGTRVFGFEDKPIGLPLIEKALLMTTDRGVGIDQPDNTRSMYPRRTIYISASGDASHNTAAGDERLKSLIRIHPPMAKTVVEGGPSIKPKYVEEMSSRMLNLAIKAGGVASEVRKQYDLDVSRAVETLEKPYIYWSKIMRTTTGKEVRSYYDNIDRILKGTNINLFLPPK